MVTLRPASSWRPHISPPMRPSPMKPRRDISGDIADRASVDDERLARQVAGGIGREEPDHARDLIGLSPSLQRDGEGLDELAHELLSGQALLLGPLHP